MQSTDPFSEKKKDLKWKYNVKVDCLCITVIKIEFYTPHDKEQFIIFKPCMENTPCRTGLIHNLLHAKFHVFTTAKLASL